jgi:hypothetical protein
MAAAQSTQLLPLENLYQCGLEWNVPGISQHCTMQPQYKDGLLDCFDAAGPCLYIVAHSFGVTTLSYMAYNIREDVREAHCLPCGYVSLACQHPLHFIR